MCARECFSDAKDGFDRAILELRRQLKVVKHHQSALYACVNVFAHMIDCLNDAQDGARRTPSKCLVTLASFIQDFCNFAETNPIFFHRKASLDRLREEMKYLQVQLTPP